jgi:hypothetical protein
MAVDIEWNGDDFVLTQDNDGKVHTIYLAPHALYRLVEFATEIERRRGIQVPAAQPADGSVAA